MMSAMHPPSETPPPRREWPAAGTTRLLGELVTEGPGGLFMIDPGPYAGIIARGWARIATSRHHIVATPAGVDEYARQLAEQLPAAVREALCMEHRRRQLREDGDA
jgi:hypothetical protein